jgi:hypothetical protein
VSGTGATGATTTTTVTPPLVPASLAAAGFSQSVAVAAGVAAGLLVLFALPVATAARRARRREVVQ